MTKKITIKDIAKELNTNYSTVSRALNNSSRISTETKKNVLKQAKLMGYQPNSFARQLKRGYSNTIGLIVPRINRVFFSNVIHGVETIAKQNGFNVIICQSNENKKEEADNIATLLSNNVAGVIMSLSRETNSSKSFKEILKRKVPFVMFDRTLKDFYSNQVVNNNFQGAYDVTEHLIKQGYKNIAHLTGPLFINIYEERLNGYKQALADHKILFKDEMVIEDVLTKEKGYAATQLLLDNKLVFDAVFAAGDYAALGAMLCLQENQIDVPEQAGVAGFANEPFTELIGLTSVEQFSTEIGKSAAQLLLEEIAINHKDIQNNDNVESNSPVSIKDQQLLTSKITNETPISKNKNIEILPELIIRTSTNRIQKLSKLQ